MPKIEFRSSPNVPMLPQGSQYENNDSMFGDLRVTNGRPVGTDAVFRDRRVNETWKEVEAQGYQPFSLISTHKFELHSQLGVLGSVYVAAADPKKGYAKTTIWMPVIFAREAGEGAHSFTAAIPAQLGRDVLKQWKEQGGLIGYLDPDGTREPTAEELAHCRDTQYAWYKRLHRQGTQIWAKHPGQHQLIDDNMRDAARAMHARGDIVKLPDWVSATRDESIETECPACANFIRKNAKKCLHCDYIIDVEFFAAQEMRKQEAMQRSRNARETLKNEPPAASPAQDDGEFSDEDLAMFSDAEAEETQAQPASPDAPVKRGRGRPPKQQA